MLSRSDWANHSIRASCVARLILEWDACPSRIISAKVGMRDRFVRIPDSLGRRRVTVVMVRMFAFLEAPAKPSFNPSARIVRQSPDECYHCGTLPTGVTGAFCPEGQTIYAKAA